MPFSKILLLGDSLTQTCMAGWGGGLADIYQRRADVLNRGMSGYNTRWFIAYAKEMGILGSTAKKDDSVVLVTIFFGANDASLAELNPHAHVPVEEFKTNLVTMIDLSKQAYPNAKILLITLPPVHHGQRLAFQKQRYREKATGILERTLENAGLYAEATKEVAAKYINDDDDDVLRSLDLYQAMLDASSEEDDHGKFFYDGLHFNATGHAFVLKELQDVISKEFLDSIAVTPCPHTGQWNNSGSKSAIPNQGAYHDAIDHTKWQEAFL